MEIEKFQSFIKTMPLIKEDVLNGKYSWQQLYELYALYGEDDSFWDAYKKKNVDMNSIIDMIKKIDLNMISENIDYLMKILNMFSSLTQKKEKTWYDQ